MSRAGIGLALAAVLSLTACGQAMDKAKDASTEASDIKAGQDFLAKTAKEPGVVKLPSGLMYKVVADPDPTAPRPAADDTVKIHYEGKLVDGTVFDSSYDRGVPAVFPLAHLVKAWQIGIPLMHKGDTYMLYVPPELGYGSEDMGQIPPNSVLVFKVQLLDIAGK